jgi:hypothetical protein
MEELMASFLRRDVGFNVFSLTNVTCQVTVAYHDQVI